MDEEFPISLFSVVSPDEPEVKPDELEEFEESVPLKPAPFEFSELDVEVPDWLCAALLFPCASVYSENEELLFAAALLPCVSAVPDDALFCVTIPSFIFVLFPAL